MTNYIISISTEAFELCTNLLHISLPHNLSYTTITAKCFKGASKLRTIIIPSAITHINDAAFQHCTRLRIIIFEGIIPTVGNNAFNNIHSDAIIYFKSTDGSWTEGSTFPTTSIAVRQYPS